MNLKCKRFTYGLLALLISLNIFSVVAAEPEVYEEEEVVVTATRTPRGKNDTPGETEVITKEEIKMTGAETVAEALAKDGLVVSNQGGAAAVSTVQLDGFSSGQTLVLTNGIPVNTGATGTVDLSYFPTAGIDKIEIVHGPLSALYGSNALGGVVNIITDLTGEPQTNLGLARGSFDMVKASFTLQQENFGVAVGGLTTDGHRDQSGTDNLFVLAQYDFFQDDTGYLTMDLTHQVKDSQNPGPQDGVNPLVDEYAVADGIDWRGKFDYGKTSWEYKLIFQSNDYRYEHPTMPARHQTISGGTDIAMLYSIGGHDLLSGFMLRQDRFDSTSVGERRQDNGALFFQDEWRFHETWRLVSGLRWDTGSDYSSPVSPRISLVHPISENSVVKLGYGKAFRAPTVNDLYWPEDEFTAGNPDLKPELSERIELSGEWQGERQWVIAGIFTADIEDGINWGLKDSKYRPVNIDRMRVHGLSIAWFFHWNEWLGTHLQYRWNDKQGWNETTRDYSNDLNFFGSRHWTFNLNFKHDKWFANLDWHWVLERSTQSDPVTFETVTMPDYDVLGLNLGYQVNPQIKYQLTVNNLTNQSYQIHSRYPLPGREILFTINTAF
ncbi:MAG: TonB-dependent receptor plug domain-containing protein [Bacteroidota bacterium]